MIERIATSNAGRRFLLTLAQRQGEVDRRAAGRLVVEIAPGRLDPLADRFLHVLDDAEELLLSGDEIRREDLYSLGLRRLTSGAG